jgi:hypothetical protein
VTLTTTAGRPPLRLTWWQIAGGGVLPILSAVAQLSLLQADTLGPWLCWGYAAFGVVALMASARSLAGPFERSFVCGANYGCAAGSLLSAIDHFLYSYFYAWPVALVTIIPFSVAAALVNGHRARMLLEERRPHLRCAIAFGALAAFVVPVSAQVAETQWIEANMAHFWSGDSPAAAAAAVRALNRYPLRFGRFTTDVCEQVVIDRSDVWSDDKDLVRQLEIMLGPDFWHCEPRDPHG